MAKRNIIITGGAGFIGSHVVRLFVNKYPDYNIINLDKLTYAGNLANLKDVEDKPNYKFVKMDICDFEAIYRLMQDEKIDGIIHLAAESHVDRSIKDPFTFARTNVMGTLSLLQAAKLYWESLPEGYAGKRFYHISTDEVYGALEMNHPEGIEPPFSTTASSTEHHLAYGDDFFYETTKYNPHSPYSAAKASSDHFVRAYHDTYGLPTIVTNCSNNYGPYQFPEKLIPLFINNIRHRKPLPVYGKGENVRDWLYVEDHARAIDLIFHQGKVAETYNIGGFNEWKNIDLIKVMIKTVDRILGNPKGHSLGLITYVADRLGHDTRYAIDSTKLQKELGWEPSLQFEEEGIEPPFSTTASSTEHHLAYGDDFFYETTKYNPHSPYSAAKASSDHFVRAYHDTYGLPTIVTNCSNNYGPYQFPEKLIPLFINNIRHRKPLPVYGKGENVRDWLYVEDHARAIDLIFHQGKVAETYNIGGFNEWKNIDLIKVMIKTVDRILGNPKGHSLGLITYVADRLGHDTRYAIDSTKLQKELGWEPSLQFEEGIEKTVRWYLENQEWMDHVTSGDYQRYYENMYKAQ